MKKIPLTQGEFAIVDDRDFEELSRWRWSLVVCKSGIKYAARGTRNRKEGTQETILMHRQITRAPKGKRIDHRDGDGLNNRRKNLRFATPHQNCCNSKKPLTNRSGFKGVFANHYQGKRKSSTYFTASIRKGKSIHIGSFKTAEEAAKAYNAKALELFGEFARLNPI